MAESTGEIATTTPIYDDETLAGIKSFDDAMQVLADAGVEATEIAEYGDGFSVMRKDEFVNVPFVIFDYKFALGDYKDDSGRQQEFAILRIVAKDGRKAILTDGSTGVRDKVRQLEKRGVKGGIVCPKGFTVSEYEYVDRSTGVATPARTFYLSE